MSELEDDDDDDGSNLDVVWHKKRQVHRQTQWWAEHQPNKVALFCIHGVNLNITCSSCSFASQVKNK